MIGDYAAEYCHAYEAAVGALAKGRDPLAAAQGSVGPGWIAFPIARAATESARRDFGQMAQAAE